MKKDQLYFFTFFGLTCITFIVSYFSMNYLLEVSTSHFLRVQIESGKQKANEISHLMAYQIESGLSKEVVIRNLQKSIENHPVESGFISVFDWSGIQVCHPNPEKIGQQILPNKTIDPVIYNELNPEEFYTLLSGKNEKKHLEESTDEQNSEVIYLYPVRNTDWIVAAHAQVDSIKE